MIQFQDIIGQRQSAIQKGHSCLGREKVKEENWVITTLRSKVLAKNFKILAYLTYC